MKKDKLFHLKTSLCKGMPRYSTSRYVLANKFIFIRSELSLSQTGTFAPYVRFLNQALRSIVQSVCTVAGD